MIYKVSSNNHGEIMITISDSFSFNAVSNKGPGFDAVFRVRRLKDDEVKDTVRQLLANHADFKSIVSTKKAAEDFSKILGLNITKFSSKLFSREDFMKVNRTNILLFAEAVKDPTTKAVTYIWYLVSIPESADPNQ